MCEGAGAAYLFTHSRIGECPDTGIKKPVRARVCVRGGADYAKL